ncbi:GntR family transcriptional regulator [uncultured Sneathiella sp.]|jgi:DNA-binding GntR family transcriptional regulator|uniref:GntR family transcriptional regulator n=1 Tax=uncultured Sneathiella sp. TaxID=879315 RepID=UPI0030DA441E|tara:strand:- start:41323 stop:42078 length:756 start_codon:yes stop_codon:yes gene_type:complete
MSRTAPTVALNQSGSPTRKGVNNDYIYEEMFAAILEQRLAPGTKLSEDTLGEIFSVSRTVIRAVLQRLAHERIVQIHPNRGAFVSEPSPAEAQEVLQARRLIEAGIVREAIRKQIPSDMETLRRSVAAERESLEKGDHESWVRLSGDFHLKLAAIAKNRTLAAYVKELVSRTSLIIVQYQKGNVSPCSCDEHTEIIKAIEAHEEERAVELMIAHLKACEDQLNLRNGEVKVDLFSIFAKPGNRAVKKRSVV